MKPAWLCLLEEKSEREEAERRGEREREIEHVSITSDEGSQNPMQPKVQEKVDATGGSRYAG